MMMDNFRYLLLVLLIPASVAYAESYDIHINSIENFTGCQNNYSCWPDGSIVINQYDSVTWYNDVTGYSISVTSGVNSDDDVGGSFDSGIILPDREYSHTFEESGVFQYFSVLQPWMSGIITVNPSEMPVEPVIMDPEPTSESHTIKEPVLKRDIATSDISNDITTPPDTANHESIEEEEQRLNIIDEIILIFKSWFGM